MKKTIRIYLNTILLFLIPFTLISFILAILSYFMQMNSLVTNIIVQATSYVTLLISALYFTSQMKEKRITHCFCLSLFYFLITLLIHLGNINFIHLFLKSLIFMAIGLYKEIRDRN